MEPGCPQQIGASTIDQAVALPVFVLLGTLGGGAPVAIYHAAGDKATKIPGQLHERMVRENATIMAVICVIVGQADRRRAHRRRQLTALPRWHART